MAFPTLTMPTFFQRLPTEILLGIFHQLDYQSLIYLAGSDRFLHQAVDPQIATSFDKLAFVMRAERDFPQNFPRYIQGQEHPGRFACYSCCRVRGPEHFDLKQPHTVIMDSQGELWRNDDEGGNRERPEKGTVLTLRRFCIECGVRDGIHRPSDLLETRTGQELWVCNCRKVWPKPAYLRCDNCGSNCRFTSRRKS